MRRTATPLLPTATAVGCLSALLLTGCGAGDADSSAASGPAQSSSSSTAGAAPSPTATATAPATDDSGSQGSSNGAAEQPGAAETSSSPEDAETRRPPGGGLPPGGADRIDGEELDPTIHGKESAIGFYSEEGAEVGVAGLDPAADPLQVYAEPTRSSEVVGELESTDAVELGGRERQHREGQDQGPWTEIRLADGYGWLTSSPESGGIYWFGGTEEITGEITEEFTEVASNEDPLELVEAVGSARVERAGGGEDGLGPSRVLVSEPKDFDEEFYRVDVTGMPDDSVSGERLFITLEDAGARYELREVRRTVICYRGVSDGGLCT